jgi:hypothetical protein
MFDGVTWFSEEFRWPKRLPDWEIQLSDGVAVRSEV